MQTRQQQTAGAVLMMVVVFTAIFLVVSGGLVSLVLGQLKLTSKKVASGLAFTIAEAGVNYYRWHLAHAPEDYQDGTAGAGPYIHEYTDPLGTVLGTYSLEITPPSEYSSVVTIRSTGTPAAEPLIARVVEAKYGRASLADFAFLTNSNVWFGDAEELHGPVHSNGGIRMDGSHDSLLTSAKETYICTGEHDCAAGGEEKPGIWGSGGNPTLWEFPITGVNFDNVAINLDDLQTDAVNSGIYIPASGLGYHVVFQADGSFDLYQVDQLRNSVWSWNGSGWVKLSHDIQSETFLQNYDLLEPATLIFIEDNIWVEGTVNGRVTLVSGELPDLDETNTTAVISNDILYAAKDGSDVLGLIAQKDILVPLYSAPSDLEIDAALMAQKGHVFRNYYTSSYSPYHLRNSITLYGAIITNTVWTWSWVSSSSGPVVSGYINTSTIYDPYLTLQPPPSFPLSGEYKILQWQEVK
jgi:hypothetical protein